MNEKNLQEENSHQEEKSNILTLLLSSILLHLLIMLMIILYRFDHEEAPEIPRMTANDQAVLWTQPPVIPPVQQPQQAKQEEKTQKKPVPKIPEAFKPLPKIMPGQQGIDKQDFKGEDVLEQKVTLPEKKEPKPTPVKKDLAKADFPKESEKKLPTPTADIIRQDQTSQNITRRSEEIQPNNIQSKESQHLQDDEQKSTKPEKKKEIIFDTDLDFLATKTVQQKLVEKDELYENVPVPQQKAKVKSISYKDIGLGFNNTSTNIGNSAHLMMQGTSPDIPKGDELKYITYLNQMANMIVASMHSNSQLHLLPRARGETIICFMKVTREGKLLDTHIVRPSKYEIINIFITESIKQVGLFNQLPKFIDKETFEINWHILT